MTRAKRATIAQIMHTRIPHLTIEERVACLEKMVELLITKHNGLERAWQKRSDRHDDWIECITVDIVDLQAHIHGPDPDLENHPDMQTLRAKHCDQLIIRKKRARRPANIIDLAAYR
jgi:hypothetical protein